jgi:riboflavin biosynthesis pyrimidine reductase
MEPIITLYEREAAAITTLPSVLAASYGGGFTLPTQDVNARPYVIANFVETLDGIISYNAPGQLDSRLISGDNAQDKMVMGLLRASADAVIFGSNPLQEDDEHLHIPPFIAPAFAAEYAALRVQQGKKERWPISVIMTRSGHINLKQKTLHTPGLHVVIATTEQGNAYLAHQALPEGVAVRIVEAGGGKNAAEIAPEGMLQMLARDYGVKVALYEGGPTLLASFLAEGMIDELFLTVAPQIAGHEAGLHRLALLEGHAFKPTDALWTTLLSVKLAGSHLLLRYRFAR